MRHPGRLLAAWAGYLLVLAAGHVYKMGYRRMLASHRDHGGAVTVAPPHSPVARAAGRFGSVEVDSGSRVREFGEEPGRPAPLPPDEASCLASMGIDVFTTQFLKDTSHESVYSSFATQSGTGW